MAGDIHLTLLDPDHGFLTELPEVLDKRVQIEHNREGSGAFRIMRSDLALSETNMARGNIVAVQVDAISDDPFMEFFLEDGDFDLISSREEGGEILKFGGPGTLTYLKNALLDSVQLLGTTQVVFPIELLWKWDTETEGNIIRRMIDEAQAHTPSMLPGLTRTFDENDDSDGTSWGDEALEGNYTAAMGANVFDEVLRFAQMGFIQIRMDPDFVFNAWRTVGRDLTGSFGSGNVRFEKAVNIITELSKSRPAFVYASHALIKGNENVFAHAVAPGWSSGMPVRWVYLEAPFNAPADLVRAAEGMLGIREQAQDQITFQHRIPAVGDSPNEAAGIYLPGPPGSSGNYWTGDLVTLHTGSGEFEFDNHTGRVFAITLTESETGRLAEPVVELGPPVLIDDGFSTEGPASPTTVLPPSGCGPCPGDFPYVPDGQEHYYSGSFTFMSDGYGSAAGPGYGTTLTSTNTTPLHLEEDEVWTYGMSMTGDSADSNLQLGLGRNDNTWTSLHFQPSFPDPQEFPPQTISGTFTVVHGFDSTILNYAQGNLSADGHIPKLATVTYWFDPPGWVPIPTSPPAAGQWVRHATLTPAADSVEDTFFVPTGSYWPNSTHLLVGSTPQIFGVDYTESDPNTGEIVFATPPATTPHGDYQGTGH